LSYNSFIISLQLYAHSSHFTDIAMSSTTKYQPAPQRDSQEYSQAPPSYQAETSTTSNANPGMFAGPRSEDDNIPDDFKVSFTSLPTLFSF